MVVGVAVNDAVGVVVDTPSGAIVAIGVLELNVVLARHIRFGLAHPAGLGAIVADLVGPLLVKVVIIADL